MGVDLHLISHLQHYNHVSVKLMKVVTNNHWFLSSEGGDLF